MRLKRLVAACALATTPACMATRQVAPAEYIPQNRPDRIMVLDEIGALRVLDGPAIVDGNLVGMEAGDTVSIAVRDVTHAVVKVKSPGRTRLLAAGIAVLSGGMIAGIAISTSGQSCQYIDNAGNPIEEGDASYVANGATKKAGC
jgi:hypothetical protein